MITKGAEADNQPESESGGVRGGGTNTPFRVQACLSVKDWGRAGESGMCSPAAGA